MLRIADKRSAGYCVNLSMVIQTEIPSRAGQICRFLNPLNDEDQDDVFIVAEDPQAFDDEDEIDVVNLRNLQRNLHQPESAQRISVQKNELRVIAADLAEYIAGWNIKA
jgi:NADPH-dependent ferric siderophore reductase